MNPSRKRRLFAREVSQPFFSRFGKHSKELQKPGQTGVCTLAAQQNRTGLSTAKFGKLDLQLLGHQLRCEFIAQASGQARDRSMPSATLVKVARTLRPADTITGRTIVGSSREAKKATAISRWRKVSVSVRWFEENQS